MVRKITLVFILGFSCFFAGFELRTRMQKKCYDEKSDLSSAVKLAEFAVDREFGQNTFVYGLRRILKDESTKIYAFQVKVKNNARTNIIVNVNMEDCPGVIRIDDAILYNFVEEWQF